MGAPSQDALEGGRPQDWFPFARRAAPFGTRRRPFAGSALLPPGSASDRSPRPLTGEASRRDPSWATDRTGSASKPSGRSTRASREGKAAD